jgi:putative transposase
MARVVAAGVPHHVTQRGNRGQKLFFCDEDYELYKSLLKEGCRSAGVSVWSYCLLPTQVYLTLVPRDEDGLRAALGDAHRRYTRHVNARENWNGFLWQGRFASFPMDEPSLLASARYVELSPVRAKLVRRARDWRWSSARAHLSGRDDALVQVKPLRERAGAWAAFLGEGLEDEEYEAIRRCERTGRPLGSPAFIRRLEKKLGRVLARQKPGPKPASD